MNNNRFKNHADSDKVMENSLLCFSSFCILYTIFKKLNFTKPRVYISLINSVFLSSLSITTFNYLINSNQDQSNGRSNDRSNDQITTLITQEPEQIWLADYAIGYFAADLFLGHVFDRKNLNILSGYIHHSVFIGLTYYVKATNQSNIIYLLLPFEIPTAFLDITHLNKGDILLDVSFGTSFFIFRIVYHVYIIHLISNYCLPYSVITSLLLLVHLYWFRGWLKKQFLQIL